MLNAVRAKVAPLGYKYAHPYHFSDDSPTIQSLLNVFEEKKPTNLSVFSTHRSLCVEHFLDSDKLTPSLPPGP